MMVVVVVVVVMVVVVVVVVLVLVFGAGFPPLPQVRLLDASLARTSPCVSVRQLKAFRGIFSTSISLFSIWTEAKVVPKFRGWHTPHLFTSL
uniref:Secreted protein n=1 Tax=Knipowitschia caucasica TaxID=637954 RepID=A0AAV2LZ15_KNICA